MNEEINEEIVELISQRKLANVKVILSEMNPADIALLAEDLPIEDLPLMFRLLPKETAADAFANMDTDMQEALLTSFTERELKEVMDGMYLDDTVDLIEEMPANIVRRIIRTTSPEERKIINEILKYPKDSAGSIMTIEFIDLNKEMTVSEAFERIRKIGIDKETVYTCYVIDNNRFLQGIISVKTLLLAEPDEKIKDLMEENYIFVNTLEDKEDVAQMFDKYDFIVIPVVDNEHRLVGIVTFDDAIEVLQDEATEDIEKMAAIMPTDKSYMKTGVIETWKKRIPWLLLLMISATFTGSIISNYEAALSSMACLTAFIPMFMDTGGNAGGQASVTIIRGLALNEIELSDVLKIVWKEIRVAFICGLTLAVANFAKIMLFDARFNPNITVNVALVVCITMVLTVLFAKIVGSTLPLLAKKVGFDPAVMASPFITTIVDAISLIVYFRVATIMLGI